MEPRKMLGRIVLVGWLLGSLTALPGTAAVAAKGFPWGRVPGIVADDFRPEFLAKVAGKLEQLPCYGRCTDSIAACLSENPPHSTAARLARDVFGLMASETSEEDIHKWIDLRRKMAHPKPVDIRGIELDGLHPLGSPKAEVIIVEYSDFQCPFCAMISPLLEQVARENSERVRLYFKQFPIKGHPRALAAARACVAADAFGKFWDYCPDLFKHQADLSDAKLVELAQQVGIDPGSFKKKMASEEVLNRIADEKMEGLKNRVQGTPTIFINGKEFLAQPTHELLRDRIDEEIDILHGRD